RASANRSARRPSVGAAIVLSVNASLEFARSARQARLCPLVHERPAACLASWSLHRWTLSSCSGTASNVVIVMVGRRLSALPASCNNQHNAAHRAARPWLGDFSLAVCQLISLSATHWPTNQICGPGLSCDARQC